ncbi:MAG: hypothetical protein M1830_005610 [Pleopsidium flavum]|nr:MAG: hypothetical protein M1830_005610 [Pleopsidium flavum]
MLIDVRSFVSQDPSHGVPVSLTKGALLELLEKNGVPPSFIEVYVNNNGACTGSPIYCTVYEKHPSAYQLYIKFSTAPSVNAAIYFRHDLQTRQTQLESRFQQLFPHITSNTLSPPRDPFVILSAIAAEYVSVMESERRRLDAMTCEQESKTGITAHYYDDSLRVRPSELPSRIKALHVCDAYLMFFIDAVNFQTSWVAFLQQQHRIVSDLRTKMLLDADANTSLSVQSISSQKVRVSLELSASLLHNILLQVRTLSRRIQIQISVVQNLIAQGDSRTNISIANDSKRIALDAKKDSVAMKTIAGLTMVFLPGTFTATLFSMVFFHVGEEPSPQLSVNSHWWLYVAVTIPLTGLVLAVWAGWLRWKSRAMPKDKELLSET